MIHVADLRVDYDGFCAVRDLSFDVAPGQVCGLIGPNGAGKTTTMRSMLGLVEPTYGAIEIAGVDMRERPRDACRLVAFMPDFPPMYDDLKVWEFLDLFAASYFIPRSERRRVVAEYLELVGLTEKRDEMVPTLSRGMRQRLMLAKSLLHEPQVLLLDEPASGVDPRGRIDLKNALKRLSAEGRTILISSHILAEMTEFCTSVAIMERGRMVVSGTVDEVRARLFGAGVLRIELLDGEGGDRLREIAASDPKAAGCEQLGPKTFEVPYAGDDEATARFLASLVEARVPVCSFSRHREGLEELFLKVGAKELS